MNKYQNVHILVEGPSEAAFVREVLKPYCSLRGVFITASVLSKSGQKGGDVKFSRSKKEIYAFLRQRPDRIVCTFVDYYGVSEWPKIDTIPSGATPACIAEHMNQAACQGLMDSYPDLQNDIDRYIPFVAVHEFETLLFSDSTILARELNVKKKVIDKVLREFGAPERINNSPATAPSKRILSWCPGYAKVRKGLAIAKAIGIDKMRSACPLFNSFLLQIGVPQSIPPQS